MMLLIAQLSASCLSSYNLALYAELKFYTCIMCIAADVYASAYPYFRGKLNLYYKNFMYFSLYIFAAVSLI